MKLATALACVGLLCGGVALAQSQPTATPRSTATPPSSSIPATSPRTSSPRTPAPQAATPVNPSTPAASTTTASPARTGRTASAQHYTRAERVARREMCSSAARQRGLTGSARTRFMRSCHLQVVAR